MNGELRPPTPPPPKGELQEPTKPPCEVALRSLLDLSKEPLEKQLDAANTAAKVPGRSKDCPKYLGAIGVVCVLPVEGDTPDLTMDKVLEIRESMHPVSIRRFSRALKGPREPVSLLDAQLRFELGRLGFPQPGRQEDPLAEPPLRYPVSDTSTLLSPGIQPLPTRRYGRDATPRKATSVVELQPRPACAKNLVRFYLQHAKTIKDFEMELQETGKLEEMPPIDHSEDHEIYRKAMEHIADAKPEDCAKCLRDLCPLKNNIEPNSLYNSTNRSKEGPTGAKIKASEVIVRIARGEPREAETVEAIDITEHKLRNRIKEAKTVA